MTKCEKCEIEYPDGLVCAFNDNNYIIKNVCGICALELSNEIHKTIRTHFNGTLAEETRKKAIEWRKQLKQQKRMPK